MTGRNIVLQSVNAPDGRRCVDIFRRPDGGFGYDEFRRDPEDARGWYPIGFHGDRVFATEDEALENARATVPWFNELRTG